MEFNRITHLKNLANKKLNRGFKTPSRTPTETFRHEINIRDKKAEFIVRNRAESKSFETAQMAEISVVEDLTSRLSEDDVVYDVGAWYGLYSVAVGLHGADIHAFEPLPYRADRLARNLINNQVMGIVHEIALSDSTGELKLNLDNGSPEGKGNTVTVDQHVGDKLIDLNSVPNPHWIKIDVEGGEMGVIRGLEESLERRECKGIYVEVHTNKVNPDNIYEKLNDAGFNVTEIDNRGAEMFLRGLKDT